MVSFKDTESREYHCFLMWIGKVQKRILTVFMYTLWNMCCSGGEAGRDRIPNVSRSVPTVFLKGKHVSF